MTSDTIQVIGKYVIAVIVVVGCLILIGRAAAGIDTSPAWGLLGLIVGWLIRDSAGQAATTNAVKTIVAAQGAPQP